MENQEQIAVIELYVLYLLMFAIEGFATFLIEKMSLAPDLGVVSSKKKHFVCNVGPQAKQHRLPFPTSCISTRSAFELIHVDSWGPYHIKTYGGNRYFRTVVDDYTRATSTHIMVTKDTAISVLKSFVIMD